MKNFSYSLFIAFTLLYGCTNDSFIKNKTGVNDTAVSQQLNNTLTADKMTAVYSYDSTYTDSTLVCMQWFLKDSLLKKQGEFRYDLPLEGGFTEAYIISEAGAQPVYETFDSLICEVGGRSAWNKYVFTYDSDKRPTSVKHFKAWYENYDANDNPFYSTRPDYFLGEQTYFTYTTNKTEQVTKDKQGKTMERLTSIADHQSRLVFQERYRRDDYEISDDDRVRIYYRYKNSRNL